MGHQSDLKRSKYRNWVKGGLAYKYLKEGIEDFADAVVIKEHRRILQNVKHTLVLDCNQCSLRDLRPLHKSEKDFRTDKIVCPWSQVKCNCLLPENQTWTCPNNICDTIFDEILKGHGSQPPTPNWKNTDIQKWCSSPWEIAKCFISAPGYVDKTEATDIDAQGLLHVFINNINIQTNIANGTDVFSRVLRRQRTLFNSTMGLEDKELNDLISDVIYILEEEKKLKDKRAAKQAVEKLRQLKQDYFIITTDNEVDVYMSVIANRSEELKQKIEACNNHINRVSRQKKAARHAIINAGRKLTPKSIDDKTEQAKKELQTHKDSNVQTISQAINVLKERVRKVNKDVNVIKQHLKEQVNDAKAQAVYQGRLEYAKPKQAEAEVEGILKDGIKDFVKKTLEDQHVVLLKKANENAATDHTRLCSVCNKQNLLPKHSKELCPSKKDCLCKKKTKGRRPCPNGICDSLFQTIIESHRTLSPNMKNTDIKRWTEDYWEIAKCFMAHDTRSLENTDVMDLLHIMANDEMMRRKLGLLESELDEETDDFLNEIIQALKTIRRQGEINISEYVETYHGNMTRLLDAIGDDYAKDAKLQLEQILENIKQNEAGIPFVLSEKMRRKVGTDSQEFMEKLENAYTEHFFSANEVLTKQEDGIQLDFVQKAFIVTEPDRIDNVYDLTGEQLKETTTLQGLALGRDKAENIRNNVLAVYSTNDERDWLVDSIFRWKFQFRADTSTSQSEFEPPKNVIILTPQFASKLGLSLQAYRIMASKAIETKENCIIVLDLFNNSMENLLMAERYEQTHTIIRMIHRSQFHKYRRTSGLTILILGGIKELVLSDTECVFRPKNSDSMKLCLYRCFKKIGRGTLEKLTFENILFDAHTTRVSVPGTEGLKIIKLKASKLVPIANFIEHLELEDVSFRRCDDFEVLCAGMRGIKSIFLCGQTSDILTNIKSFVIAWQFCPHLESIFTSSTKIGKKETVILDVRKATLEKYCGDYFGKSCSSCTYQELTSMVQLDINTQLFDIFEKDDLKNASTEVEKQFILDSVSFCLLQNKESYVDVYPATSTTYQGDILLICITKEDRYLSELQNACGSEQTLQGGFRGFKTVEKNMYASTSTCSIYNELNFEQAVTDYYKNHFDNVNGVVQFHAENLLNKHRNIVSVAVSLGKGTPTSLDLDAGPHVVLYVRAKSFIPFGENMFPKELEHKSAAGIKYPVDVREGYYIPVADSLLSNYNATDKLPMLAMGCSIGGERIPAGGTMGPLVEYKKDRSRDQSSLGFLTACHLFRKPEDYNTAVGIKVVQPSDADEKVDMYTGRRIITPNKICGEVIACRFTEEIDAALVRIDNRAPTSSKFITPSLEDYEEAGFSFIRKSGKPVYKEGRSLGSSDLTVRKGNADKRVIKFGKTTGLRRGSLQLQNMAVRITKVILPGICPISLTATDSQGNARKVTYQHKLVQQMQVTSTPERSFFQKGDSGCGVFLADNENHLWCIGMGVGILSDSLSVVTPIQAILNGLQSSLGPNSEVILKDFDQEEMITD